MSDAKNALDLFSKRIDRYRASTLTSRARLQPSDARTSAQVVVVELPSLLDDDEALPIEEQTLSAGKRRRLRVLLAGILDDALAFQGADIYLTTTPTEPDPGAAELALLVPVVRDLDAELRAHLTAHFRNDAEVTRTLKVYHRGTGREDDAQDVLGYSAIARTIPAAERRWSDAWLTAAEEKATRQLQLLDSSPPAVKEMRILRNRCWAEFEANYEALWLAGFHLSGGDSTRFRRLSPR